MKEFLRSCCWSLMIGLCFLGARAEAEADAESVTVALFGLFLLESSLTLKDPRSEFVFVLPFAAFAAPDRCYRITLISFSGLPTTTWFFFTTLTRSIILVVLFCSCSFLLPGVIVIVVSGALTLFSFPTMLMFVLFACCLLALFAVIALYRLFACFI